MLELLGKGAICWDPFRMPRQRLTFGNKTDPFYGNFPRKKSLLIAVAVAAAVGEEDPRLLVISSDFWSGTERTTLGR